MEVQVDDLVFSNIRRSHNTIDLSWRWQGNCDYASIAISHIRQPTKDDLIQASDKSIIDTIRNVKRIPGHEEDCFSIRTASLDYYISIFGMVQFQGKTYYSNGTAFDAKKQIFLGQSIELEYKIEWRLLQTSPKVTLRLVSTKLDPPAFLELPHCHVELFTTEPLIRGAGVPVFYISRRLVPSEEPRTIKLDCHPIRDNLPAYLKLFIDNPIEEQRIHIEHPVPRKLYFRRRRFPCPGTRKSETFEQLEIRVTRDPNTTFAQMFDHIQRTPQFEIEHLWNLPWDIEQWLYGIVIDNYQISTVAVEGLLYRVRNDQSAHKQLLEYLQHQMKSPTALCLNALHDLVDHVIFPLAQDGDDAARLILYDLPLTETVPDHIKSLSISLSLQLLREHTDRIDQAQSWLQQEELRLHVLPALVQMTAENNHDALELLEEQIKGSGDPILRIRAFEAYTNCHVFEHEVATTLSRWLDSNAPPVPRSSIVHYIHQHFSQNPLDEISAMLLEKTLSLMDRDAKPDLINLLAYWVERTQMNIYRELDGASQVSPEQIQLESIVYQQGGQILYEQLRQLPISIEVVRLAGNIGNPIIIQPIVRLIQTNMTDEKLLTEAFMALGKVRRHDSENSITLLTSALVDETLSPQVHASVLHALSLIHTRIAPASISDALEQYVGQQQTLTEEIIQIVTHHLLWDLMPTLGNLWLSVYPNEVLKAWQELPHPQMGDQMRRLVQDQPEFVDTIRNLIPLEEHFSHLRDWFRYFSEQRHLHRRKANLTRYWYQITQAVWGENRPPNTINFQTFQEEYADLSNKIADLSNSVQEHIQQMQYCREKLIMYRKLRVHIKESLDLLNEVEQARLAGEHSNNQTLHNRLQRLQARLLSLQDESGEVAPFLSMLQNQINAIPTGSGQIADLNYQISEIESRLQKIDTQIARYDTEIDQLEQSIALLQRQRNAIEPQYMIMQTHVEAVEVAYREFQQYGHEDHRVRSSLNDSWNEWQDNLEDAIKIEKVRADKRRQDTYDLVVSIQNRIQGTHNKARRILR